MSILDIIKTANSNLWRSKMRTFLTLLAIFVGTFTITLTTAVGEGIKDYVDKQFSAFSAKEAVFISSKQAFGGNPFESLKVSEYKPEEEEKSATTTLSDNDLAKIQSVAGIEKVYPYYFLQTEYITTEGAKKYNLATLEIFYPGYQTDLAAGELVTADETDTILLNYNFIEPFGFKTPEGAIGKTVEMSFKNAQGEQLIKKLKVKGVLINTFIGQTPFLPFNLAKEIYAFQSPVASSYIASTALVAKDTSAEQMKKIKEDLGKLGYSARTYDDGIQGFKIVITIVQMVLGVFGLIVILAAALGIINTLFMSVYERTREIGLMKALGMRRRSIFAIFSFEALSIGLWGGLLGILGAIGLGTLINNILSNGVLKNFEGFNLMTYPLPIMLMILLGAMIIGFVAGALPALKAARLNPIDALRQE